MDGQVQEVGSGPLHGGFDVSLGDTVLELGVRGAESVRLGLEITVGLDCSGGKDTIVGVIVLDGEAVESRQGLKVVLACEGLGGIGGELRVDEDAAGPMVDVEGAAGVACLLAAVGVKKAALNGRMEMVCRDTVTRREVVALEYHVDTMEAAGELVVDGLTLGRGQCRAGGRAMCMCF